ncbi:MAG: TolC family protein [Ignavibacteria bacterium]|nr:TolC family protein [Ignavibacteria bacterium]
MKTVIITLTIIFLLPLVSFCQKTELSLTDAINIAMKNNPDVRISELEILKAERKISEVYSESLIPNLTLSSRYTRSVMKQTINIFGQNFEIGADNSLTTVIDVSEPIPILGTPVFTGIRIAKYYKNLQEENARMSEIKIKSEVKKYFYNVLLLKEIVKVNKKSLENSEENLRVVEARYKAGVALEYDYIRARVQTETLKPQLAQSENNLLIAKKVLKNTLGLKGEEDIDVKGELTYDSLEVWGSSDEIIRKVSSEHISLRQLKYNLKINQQLAEVDYANYLPKLYLFGQYQLQTNENDGRSIKDYRFYNSIVAGIGLTWNLNVFRNSYKEDQTLIEIKKNQEQIQKTKELLKTQTQNVILKLEDARNRIKTQSELVNVAQRGYELASVSYKNGVLNQIDVLDAELTLNKVRLAYLQAVYDFLIARTELEELLEK